MGKARHNGRGTILNLETLCLDCGTKGFISSTINSKGYYEIYNEVCPICIKQTTHIKCKSLDELKSKLEFGNKEYGLNQQVLDVLEKSRVKKLR